MELCFSSLHTRFNVNLASCSNIRIVSGENFELSFPHSNSCLVLEEIHKELCQKTKRDSACVEFHRVKSAKNVQIINSLAT